MRQKIQYLSLFLVIGGFGVLGVAAGVQVGISVFAGFLDCPTEVGLTGPTPCQQAISQLSNLVLIFLVGGIVGMFSGGLGLWQLNHLYDD